MKKVLGIISLFAFGTGFGQVNGTEMFDESVLHEIRITFEQEEFWDSLEYYYAQYLDFDADKQYMMASVEIDGTVIDSVGVREKGYYSNWGSEGLKEPLKIDLNEYVSGTKYDGLKKLNLSNGFGDPSIMRDALAYKFMRDAGVAAPRTSYAKVYLNDTYWGLYIVVEQVDDRFLKNWYENDNGNIFKCIDNTNMDWQGSVKTAYEDEFELKTNEELDDWTEFIDLVDKVNDDSEFEDSIATQLQMNNYLRVLAADVLMYNWDSYYEHGRNFYMYYDSIPGAFQWIPWDYNLAFSETTTDIVIEYTGGGPFGSDPKPLVENVMASDVYREMYFNHLCVMIDNYFTLDNLEAYLDDSKAIISDAVDEDPNKYYSTSNFNTNINSDITVVDDWGFPSTIPGLKSFVAGRYSTVSGQLDSHDHSCTALSVDEVQKAVYSVYPNPSSTGMFTVSFGDEVDQINVYTIYGQHLISKPVNTEEFIELDLSGYSDGIYVIELAGASKTQMRLVKQ